ncbi:MAG: type II toxin-antitoxin system Phd/YefM family antitoxin [Reyranellaceae bacterium]
MPRATRIKPISYVKANAAEIIQELAEVGEPLIITQNGEAKAVLQDIVSYERTQETLALLKILSLAERSIEEGRYRPAAEVFRDLRHRLKTPKADP